jgi:hypothetical protein
MHWPRSGLLTMQNNALRVVTNNQQAMLTTATPYQKKMLWLIGISIIVKVILSYFIELGNDEVYYYTYAVQPDWNHFDHPGMVGWMMRITSLNLFWVNAFSMRLGSIICAALATYTIFKTGTLLKDERAGFIAAWMYTISIYTSIIAGLFVLPDSPQLLFFTWSIYWMVKYIQQPQDFKTKDWLLLGLCIGLATLSKVHGLYLWIGFGAFILFHQTKTLQKRNLYLAILVTVICVLPILYWNIQNHFITYKFHSNRVMHTGLLLDSFVQQIVGELIYQNPLVYVTVLIALVNYKKMVPSNDSSNATRALPLLLWLSLPLLFTFWALSLFNPTLPHWTGPAYISLFLISGVYWSAYLGNKNSAYELPGILKYATGLLTGLILGVLLLIYVFPKQLGSTKFENLGEYNPINDLTGWEQFTNSFEMIVQNDISKGVMKPNTPIVIHKWFPGGHLLFYTARPLHMRVIAVGKLEDVHKFAWLNQTSQGLKLGEDAYYIVPSNLPVDPHVLYSDYFEQISQPDIVPLITKGVLLRNFYVYRLKNCKKIPQAILAEP